jgi:exosome complex RNA-binding protein Csl4
MIYRTGEKPGKGLYQCTKCDQTVRLDDDSDTLPPCPKCDNTEYRKIS